MFKPKKLILSIFTLGLTAVTLTSTTYAWFARNNEAWTEDFNLNIENTENLLISVDGINYKTSLSNSDLKKAITSKLLNKELGNLTEEEITKEYNSIQLSTVSTKDLKTFSTIDPISTENGYYKIVTSDKYKYLSFDIYFRLETSQMVAADSYDLKIVDDLYAKEKGIKATSFTSKATTIKLNNTLMALDTFGNILRYGPGEKLEGDNSYDRTTITVNPINAIRLGFSYNDSSVIYEPYIGLGSYAIESHKGLKDIYDPSNNAMLTYFNNIYEYKLNTLNDDDYTKTFKSFSEGSLAQFVKGEDGLTYNDVKLTTYIWLEGYDADYIPGIDVNKLSAYLCFYKSEKGGTI